MTQFLKPALWAAGVLIGGVILVTLWRENVVDAPAMAGAPQVDSVRVMTSDHQNLAARLFLPRSESGNLPGVVFLGPYLESSRLYDDCARLFASRGLAALVVDVRHSGESVQTDSPGDAQQEFANLDNDATAALNFLAEHPRVDKQALGILGSVISGRAAVMSSRNREDVRAIALVSSLLDGEAKDAIKSRADRPINVIVSMQDALAAGQAREIYDLCEHPGNCLLYTSPSPRDPE